VPSIAFEISAGGLVMSVSKERTVSLWMNTDVAPEAAPLRRDETADVVVVGFGDSAIIDRI
jgi:hypothetical protein